MNPAPTHTPLRRLATAASFASLLGMSACSMTTAPEPVRDAAPMPAPVAGTSLGPASNLEPPVMVQIPTDIDPSADHLNSLAVAQAFVTTVTNRPERESYNDWRRRGSKWTTESLSSSFGGDRGPDAYRREVDARHGLAVGMVVGSSVHDCDGARCAVDVVADQTFILDGRVLDETNFVTWKLELRREASGWLVDAVGFGS